MLLSYCDDMAYPQTMFPNILGHKTREDAESGAEYLLVSVAESLLGGVCNPDIRMLGCSVLAPRCEKEKVLKPCRAACEAVRKRCGHAFEGIDMAWPYFLDCDRFFASEQEGCYDPLEGLRGGNSSCEHKPPECMLLKTEYFSFFTPLDFICRRTPRKRSPFEFQSSRHLVCTHSHAQSNSRRLPLEPPLTLGNVAVVLVFY